MTTLPMIAYQLGGQMPNQRMLDKGARKALKYSGSIPAVAEAYKNDPQTRLAESALAAGTDMSPVAQGKYAIGDGLARAAQAIMGAVAQKNQRKDYAQRENQYVAGMQTAAKNAGRQQQFAPAQTPFVNPTGEQTQGNPVPVAAQGPQAAAQALAGPQPSPAPLQRPAGLARPSAPGAPVTAQRGPAVPGVPGRRDLGFSDYRSSAYDALEDKYGAQYGVPPELIRSIRLHGERSNADQVSPAGARTVYQFTPQTRQAFIDKHGIDPWASPESAVQAAAIHLAADYKRSGGNAAEAAASYHAGPSGNGRGRVNRSYVKRVMDGMGAVPPAGSSPSAGGTVPQMEAVPDALEMPTEAPQAPAIPEQVQSNRIAIAQRLLESGNPDLVVMAQAYLDKGMEEQFQAATNSNQQAYQLSRDGYTEALNDFGNARNAARGQHVADRTAAQGRNFDRETGQVERDWRTSERVAGEQFTAEQNRLDRESSERTTSAKLDAAGEKLPNFVQKEFNSNANQIKEIDATLPLLEARPDSVGLKYSAGDVLSQRLDPQGQEARSAVANIAGLLLHGISGAAVTPQEYERNRWWLPSPNDRVDVIQTKLRRLRGQSIRSIETLHSSYGNDGAIKYDTSGGASQPAPPASGVKDPNRSTW